MNVKTAKKPQERINVEYLSRFDLQTYGNDNLYPQHLQSITNASGTAALCLNRYSKFIGGFGFASDILYDYQLNRKKETADDILQNLASDVASFGGYAIHVNYNVLGQITEISHIPFENCRLEERDDNGNVNHILIHPDWSETKTKGGKKIKVDENTIDRINVFNPNPDVVLAEMEMAGGINYYKGQVLWKSMNGSFTYPTPIYDAAITDISTDEGLGNIKYRNVRNNFLISSMLVTKKGAPQIKIDPNTGEQYEKYNEMISADDLLEFQGDENAGKIMLVALENDEDKPEVVSFPTRNWDKEFQTTEESVTSRIYAQFHQELWYSIRIGKLGFSGQVMQDAYQQYAGEVTTEQRFIERGIAAIFENWYEPALQGVDVTIEPLKYIAVENNTIKD